MLQKKLRVITSLCLVSLCILVQPNNFSLAVSDDSGTSSTVTSYNYIDQDIYDMIDSYYSGSYITSISPDTSVCPQLLFEGNDLLNAESTDSGIVSTDLYKIDKVSYSNATFQATHVALYTLEQENQSQDQGVIIFTRIVYEELNIGGAQPAIKLISVKGGVVHESSDFYCRNIWLRYTCEGTVYNSYGQKIQNYYTASTPYVGPYTGIGGVTYQIAGPTEDYYYDMNVGLAAVRGFTQGEIYYKHGSWYDNFIECVSSIGWS